jgi:hypothetical protein
MHGRGAELARTLHFGGIRRNARTQPRRLITNPEVAGSNPAPATGKALETGPFCLSRGARLLTWLAQAAARRGLDDVSNNRQVRLSLLVAIAFVLVFGATTAGRTGEQAARPRTLAQVRGSIDALAQNGRRIAWCGRHVQILTLPGRRPVDVGSRRGRCARAYSSAAFCGKGWRRRRTRTS